jgi:hypothetical protein
MIHGNAYCSVQHSLQPCHEVQSLWGRCSSSGVRACAGSSLCVEAGVVLAVDVVVAVIVVVVVVVVAFTAVAAVVPLAAFANAIVACRIRLESGIATGCDSTCSFHFS